MIDMVAADASALGNYLSNVYSQFGEDGLLAETFRRICTTNKQCFEVGAADGKWFSNSRKLIDDGWKAVLIEADETNWPELDKLDSPMVTVVHGRVEPDGDNSIDSIMSKCEMAQDMDLGVIDVDGQDYYIWNGMLKYQPRVMLVEYDHLVSPASVPELGSTERAGAGLSAICSIAVSKGYFNAFTTRTNCLFVRNEYRDAFYAGDIPAEVPISDWTPTEASGQEREIKISAILSRPRFGLNCFWDCVSEGLSPWKIPLQSYSGVFWGQCMQGAMEDAIANGVDWILTLDYDSMFTSKHVAMLIDALGENPDVDAVAALQSRRGRPLPIMVRGDGKQEMTGGLVRMTTAHFGLTLIRTEAIAKLKKPWFLGTPLADGTWGNGRLDEDIYFWHQWREAGNVLCVHTGCRIGHVEEMVAVYDEKFQHKHMYLTDWRKQNGMKTRSFD